MTDSVNRPVVEILRRLTEATRRGVYRDAAVYDGPMEKRESAFQMLVGCIISQRVRDQQTGAICRRLFSEAATPSAILSMGSDRLQKHLYGAGFYQQKTKWILAVAKHVEEHGVPDTREALTRLPGIGPKCANIILASHFKKPYIAVDTHVHRISNRLGWVTTPTPEKTEASLTPLVPTRWRRKVNLLLVAHGQLVCQPIRPRCERCCVFELCAKVDVAQVDNPKGSSPNRTNTTKSASRKK